MANHQQWRLYMDATTASYCSITELEFRTAVGVARSFSGGTLTWSDAPFGGSYDGTKAIDGNTGTDWIASSGNPWIAYDYGAGNECDIKELYVRVLNYSWTPVTMSVQYWDGAAWVTKFKWEDIRVWSGSYASQGFRQQGADEVWRFLCVAGNNSILQIAEMQFRDVVGTPRLFSGGQSYSTGATGGQVHDFAIDNDVATYWYASGPTNAWIMYDYGAGNGNLVTEFTITSNSNANDYTPKDFKLQVWDPETLAWSDVSYVTNSSGWGSNETRTFAGASPPAPTGRPCVFMIT